VLCRSICCQLCTLELIIFDMVVFRFQPVVCHLEESCQWRWASFTWMHWNFGSSVHNYWIPGLCFNKVLLSFISKLCSCHIYFCWIMDLPPPSCKKGIYPSRPIPPLFLLQNIQPCLSFELPLLGIAYITF